MFRKPRFYAVWAAVTAGALMVFLRDIAVIPWIGQTTLTLHPGGEPFPARYVLSVVFYHYPLLGAVIALVGGFSLTVVVLGMRHLFRLYLGGRAGCSGGEQKIARQKPEAPGDCPPISRTIPPRQ
ncbi:hypothetical protein EPN90_01595 [Patescibacteria group bacterium]|nr:MAG: hypothetical protein EPN90_01595 [Patescibacteria group bacterium]